MDRPSRLLTPPVFLLGEVAISSGDEWAEDISLHFVPKHHGISCVLFSYLSVEQEFSAEAS